MKQVNSLNKIGDVGFVVKNKETRDYGNFINYRPTLFCKFTCLKLLNVGYVICEISVIPCFIFYSIPSTSPIYVHEKPPFLKIANVTSHAGIHGRPKIPNPAFCLRFRRLAVITIKKILLICSAIQVSDLIDDYP